MAERESRLNDQNQPRSVLDIDKALEALANEKAADNESMEQAFSRLLSSRDPKFHELRERERVAEAGVG